MTERIKHLVKINKGIQFIKIYTYTAIKYLINTILFDIRTSV